MRRYSKEFGTKEKYQLSTFKCKFILNKTKL